MTFDLFSFIIGAGSFGIIMMMVLGTYAYFKTFKLNNMIKNFEDHIESELRKQKESILYLDQDLKSQLKDLYNQTDKIKNEYTFDIDNQRKEFDQILSGFQVELKSLKTSTSN